MMYAVVVGGRDNKRVEELIERLREYLIFVVDFVDEEMLLSAIGQLPELRSEEKIAAIITPPGASDEDIKRQCQAVHSSLGDLIPLIVIADGVGPERKISSASAVRPRSFDPSELARLAYTMLSNGFRVHSPVVPHG
ncbi:hypothetical protein COT77_01775 [Candidatus Berkelbacteria bacterium CG10_big_fil_rev_8_21_14_0_10_41_12]|uniref:Uncharacterized protein n=1 Tax=Candidatus Berkelbacteria bacterium CG10_big_fil_rev_8_21_14_0_10_41_12 TaxID=1974513 RepID=A0A2M6WX41_9BACT|nr:MAG: hypothetical protein COT77_01775 [Candidatus Berkelbacteria bacterium CG10_big_fil_rev_8_21_14_0_10_41_12]